MIQRLLRRVLGRERESFGADGHNVGRYECVVRDVDHDRVTPWGYAVGGVDAPSVRGTQDYGYGELTSRAWAEIQERVDADDVEPGTHVATVTIDLDVWGYRVEFTEAVR